MQIQNFLKTLQNKTQRICKIKNFMETPKKIGCKNLKLINNSDLSS